MLTCTPSRVNVTAGLWLTERLCGSLEMTRLKEAITVADIQIEDGIIKIANLDVQDPKAAAVLAAYPQVRWAEITRRALKIGLGYLKGGERE